MRFWIALSLFAALVFAQGKGKTIPPYDGSDGNPQHEGQPDWCQAKDASGFKKNCGLCDVKCDNGVRGQEDPKCKTYCRKGKCHCNPECETKGMKMDHGMKEGM